MVAVSAGEYWEYCPSRNLGNWGMLREVSHSNVNSRHLETRLTWGYCSMLYLRGAVVNNVKDSYSQCPNEWHAHRHKEGGTGEVTWAHWQSTPVSSAHCSCYRTQKDILRPVSSVSFNLLKINKKKQTLWIPSDLMGKTVLFSSMYAANFWSDDFFLHHKASLFLEWAYEIAISNCGRFIVVSEIHALFRKKKERSRNWRRLKWACLETCKV